MKKSLFAILLSICLISCGTGSGKVGQDSGTSYDNLPAYTGTFKGYIFLEEYQNKQYLIRDLYYSDLQPYVVNESDFYDQTRGYLDDDNENSEIPDLDLKEYVSDDLQCLNRYRVSTPIKAETEEQKNTLKDILTDFKFEIAFAKSSGASAQLQYVQKLSEPVSFTLLNDGAAIAVE